MIGAVPPRAAPHCRQDNTVFLVNVGPTSLLYYRLSKNGWVREAVYGNRKLLHIFPAHYTQRRGGAIRPRMYLR